MNIEEANYSGDLGLDENCVLEYLKNFSADFISEMEITRQAAGRARFLQDKHWAHNPLTQLLELSLVDTDGSGRYRVHATPQKSDGSKKKFLAPQVRAILEHSGHNLDLSGFG